MSNSNSYLVGRVALVLWASGVILVLSGCGSGFGAASPPLAAWERVLVEQKECEARMAIKVKAYEQDLAEMQAQPIPKHQTDAEWKAYFNKLEAWAKAHEQIRKEAFSFPYSPRCSDEAAAKMEALNRAEEWMAAQGGYGARYDAGGVEPFPVLPAHPPGSISLTPDVSAGYYWVPGLNERVFIPGQPIPPFGSITLGPSMRLGYYWVPGLSEQVFVPGQGGHLPPPPQPWPLPKPSYYP